MNRFVYPAVFIILAFCVTLPIPLSAEPGTHDSAPDSAATFHTPDAKLEGSWSFTPDPDLPNVLIIGDSISIGYTRLVRTQLQERANVFRPMQKNGHHPINAGDTQRGLDQLETWLGERDWDVIHFNWGLWDLCYRHPKSTNQGKRDKVNGHISTTPEDYRKNLTQLVEQLKATDATLIWAHTTVVPEGEAGRHVGDDIKYNRIASEIMTAHNIPINDLHALTKPFPPEDFIRPGDVHFTPAGYAKIARQVAQHITAALEKDE